jgi:hypothetical protein
VSGHRVAHHAHAEKSEFRHVDLQGIVLIGEG